MATRNLLNYFGVDTRTGAANNRFALNAVTTGELPQPKKRTIKHEIQDFLLHNVLGYLLHNWRVKTPYAYPATIGQESIHDIAENEVTIALTADWGSDTPQSEYIGDRMAEKSPHYTVHLGDIYYSGIASELSNNYGTGKEDTGIWPRGSQGSFALAGNHEMFSGGQDYYNMIKDPQRGFGLGNEESWNYTGQPAPVFCLRTSNWCILGLDTGYQSLKHGIFQFHPDNLNLELPPSVFNWLRDEVKLPEEKRGIVVLTHHQYISAFNGEDEFPGPAKQLETLLPGKEVIWIWGHEHRFSMYGRYKQSSEHIAAFGRCIGNGGMPDEHNKKRVTVEQKTKDYNLVLFDNRVSDNLTLSYDEEGQPDWKEDIGYNGYATLTINGDQLTISYYESYGGTDDAQKNKDDKVVVETWHVDTTSGSISCTGVVDLTKGRGDGQELSYINADKNPGRACGLSMPTV